MSSRKRGLLIAFPLLLSIVALLFLFAYVTPRVNAQPIYSIRLDGLKKGIGGLSSRYIVTNTYGFLVSTMHTFYDNSDVVQFTFFDMIDVDASKVYSLADMSDLPDDYIGYVIIAADGPITASLLPDLPGAVPPQTIRIDGCLTGVLSANHTFTATIAPVTTTIPITYVWQASANTTITHTAGLSDTVVYSWTISGMQVITVTATNTAGTVVGMHIITIYTPVVADFTASRASGVAPLNVVFTNTSTGDYTTSLWDFGDGVTSTQIHPSHTYIATGTYTVTLVVSGPGGIDTRVKPAYIIVRNEHKVYLPLLLRNY